MLGGEFGGQPVDVVVVAVHGQQGAPVHRGGEHLGLLQRGGDQDHGVPAGPGGGGGDRVRQVAGGGTAQDGEAQFTSRGQRHGHHAVLERVRRVAGVVLHPQVAQAQRGTEAVGLDQPGEAGLGVGVLLHGRRHGQQVPVAPDRAGAGFDGLPGDVAEVVGDLEGPEAPRARELGGERDPVAALSTRQCASGAEIEGGGRRSGVGQAGHSKQGHRTPHLPRTVRVGIGTVIDRVPRVSPVAGASTGRSLCPSG